MACFEMSLPRSKRIRLIDAQGHEEFVHDEDFPLLQAAQLAKQVKFQADAPDTGSCMQLQLAEHKQAFREIVDQKLLSWGRKSLSAACPTSAGCSRPQHTILSHAWGNLLKARLSGLEGLCLIKRHERSAAESELALCRMSLSRTQIMAPVSHPSASGLLRPCRWKVWKRSWQLRYTNFDTQHSLVHTELHIPTAYIILSSGCVSR